MKKISALIILFFLAASVFSAQLKGSVKTGFMGADIKEILWNKKGSDAQITSLLDWQTFYAPSASADIEFHFLNYFFTGAQGFYTSPFKTGIMKDSDYMNIFTNGSKERTHYSRHDNKLNNYYGASAYLGGGFYPMDQLELRAFLSYKYTYYSFTAWDGYKQYGNDPKTPMEGKIISFEAEKYYLGLGLGAQYLANEKLSLALKLNILPTISCKALDTHYRRSSPYTYFDLKNELAFDSSLLLEYKIRKNLAFSGSFDLFISSVKNGTLLQSKEKKTWLKASNPGGIKECSWNFLLGLTFIYEK